MSCLSDLLYAVNFLEVWRIFVGFVENISIDFLGRVCRAYLIADSCLASAQLYRCSAGARLAVTRRWINLLQAQQSGILLQQVSMGHCHFGTTI